ncbi:MAG: hypothetical protein AOA65_2362 [Candidatus Bathyarchaeota archaeon BA1]|nr:MAG: hypothetical protein AOA65_2362 [Candidatus Bathyarchaeota archaeon BA1]
MPVLESIMKKLRDAELSLNTGTFEATIFEYDAAIEGMLRQYLYKKYRVKVGYNWSKIADDLKEQLGEKP